MTIEIAGYEFSTAPVSRKGTVFMSAPNGEGTEINVDDLRELFDKFFAKAM